MEKIKKSVIIGLILVAILACGVKLGIDHATYQPTSKAQAIAKKATQTSKVTTFKSKNSKLTVVVYPGALVNPDAYAIWAQDLAKKGYTVKIVHFPLNLAVLDQNAAKKVVGKNEDYVIGGHSLGGAMAARYAAAKHDKHLKAVFFLGAYADKKGRLDQSQLPVLNISASRDGVMQKDKFEHNKVYLPKNTTYAVIKGGNHANFGAYGKQKGDNKATISNATQQKQVADVMTEWLQNVK